MTGYKGQISNFDEHNGTSQLLSNRSSKASTNDTSTNGSHSDVEDPDMAKDLSPPFFARAPKSQFIDSNVFNN